MSAVMSRSRRGVKEKAHRHCGCWGFCLEGILPFYIGHCLYMGIFNPNPEFYNFIPEVEAPRHYFIFQPGNHMDSCKFDQVRMRVQTSFRLPQFLLNTTANSMHSQLDTLGTAIQSPLF